MFSFLLTLHLHRTLPSFLGLLHCLSLPNNFCPPFLQHNRLFCLFFLLLDILLWTFRFALLSGGIIALMLSQFVHFGWPSSFLRCLLFFLNNYWLFLYLFRFNWLFLLLLFRLLLTTLVLQVFLCDCLSPVVNVNCELLSPCALHGHTVDLFEIAKATGLRVLLAEVPGQDFVVGSVQNLAN